MQQNRVFVLDTNRKPLMPCRPARARQLLRDGKAAVFRRFPFTIILKHRASGAVQDTAVKLDPGSKTTGIVVVADFARRGRTVVWAAELQNRGYSIHQEMEKRRGYRRRRRYKLRYRPARFQHRTRLVGWLPPSLQHRVDTTMTWVRRLMRWVPVMSLAQELARFDAQALQNPEISGIQYQQGTLFGYELREYLLEKWGRKCAYCDAENVPLEVEHIVPRSRGGTNRAGNLTLACRPCNQKKGNQDVREFLVRRPERLRQILAQARKSLRDAAAVNTTRWALWQKLRDTGLPLEVGTGGRTKYNRTQQGYPKGHWVDAACVGESGARVHLDRFLQPLSIRATGHGKRRMQNHDEYGFPKGRAKSGQKMYFGFQTGDLVRALVSRGKKAGTYFGRVLCRASGSFDIQTKQGRVGGIPYRYCHPVHRQDGYTYAF